MRDLRIGGADSGGRPRGFGTDLTPLKGMPLEDIRLTPKTITQGLEILRAMKSLKTIGLSDAKAWPAEFSVRYDKGEFK